MLAATLLVDSRCTLGEGIVWWPERRALLWTDIEGRRLWMYQRDSGNTRQWPLGDRLGSFAVCQSGRLLLGLEKGLCLARLDSPGLGLEPLAPVDIGVPTRLNDGRTDRSGNFVFGTMDLGKTKPIGSFYQYSRRHGLRRLDLDRAAIPNSICFSPDGGTMYFCDSLLRRIMQCDYEPGKAAVTNIRVFAELPSATGSPDGSVIDSEGCLWNAEWGSALVRRYSPTGTSIQTIAVAGKNPSCPAFGGTDLDELFVSTAREDMTAAELEAAPHAGGVFTATPGVRGLPDAPFADV